MPKKVEKISVILFTLILVIIFISSSMTYKQQTTVPIMHKYLLKKPFLNLLSHINIIYDGSVHSVDRIGYFKFVEFLIRKFAHFFSYLLMSFLLWISLYNQIKSKWLLLIITWLSVTGAALDEFHQQLTGGRTPLVDDVMIDSFGALVGIIIVIILLKLLKSNKKPF